MTETKSALLEKESTPDTVPYTDDENTYVGKILYRLLTAKLARDTVKIEFNGMTYLQWFRNNEAIANTTVLRDNINKDLAVYSGTVEQKLLTILAEVNRLNLVGETRVFDKDNNELQELGMAITDIVHKTEEVEEAVGTGNMEGKLLRQLELLKQGTVFIQDNWVKKWEKKKVLNGKFTGKFAGVDWETKLEKVFDGPVRSVLYGPGVYLGNMREFTIKNQPYLFTLKTSSYDECKTRFGAKDKEGNDMWERWKYVPKRKVVLVDSENLSNMTMGGGWTITDLETDMVEEIHYQDQINDEYQIFLNGVAMLPVGFPLSAITPNGMFNIEKQILQVINPFFSYGRSFIAKTEQLSKLLDEMIRLLILKTRKSIHPPYANISGKVISEKSLMPGAISMGIDPGALVKIGEEGQGATASEYQMLKELREDIDRVTISPQYQGQQGKAGTTAFEVSTLQAQAEKSLTLIIFAMGMLEKKCQWLRTNYVIANYFEPIGTTVDDAMDELTEVYRTMTVKTKLPDRGTGIRKIVLHNGQNTPTPEDVYNEEEYSDTPQPTQGHRRRTRSELDMDPIQCLYINVNILKNSKYIFFTEVESQPRDTSVNAKLMFREELRDIQALMNMGAQPNVDELEKEYALIWHKRKEKMFGKPMDPQQMAQMKGQGGANVLNDNPPQLMGGDASASQ
jgi:hypothetical protein